MKRFSLILIIFLQSCAMNKDVIITISTSYGDMKAILYEETPLHKENFIKLSESWFNSGAWDYMQFIGVIRFCYI